MTIFFNRIAILGLGLIGSSLARTLSAKKLAHHIAAYNHSDYALNYAIEQGFIGSKHVNAAEAVAGADLIILATPPHAFARLAAEIAPFIKAGGIVMDVGSVKREAISAIKPHLPAQAHYVPAHPIAGSDKAGVEAGSAELFSGRSVILTPEEAELMSDPVGRVRSLWEKMGSRVEFMPADVHDSIYAYVSHLPHMAAFAIAPFVNKTLSAENAEYARFIRLTKSSPALWADICVANADYAGEAADDFIRFATQIYGELKENAPDSEEKNVDIAVLFARLVATCLIATASLLQDNKGINPMRYAGAGFIDMTAISLTDPQELLAAISANNRKIAPLLGKMIERLGEIREALSAGDSRKLEELFTN